MESGTLIINGQFGGTTVFRSGTKLAGSGMLGGVQLTDGTTIAPGNSIGTLTIGGDLTFAPGATYEVELDPASNASDLLRVLGTATLGGIVAHIGYSGTYALDSRYTILKADTLKGAFDAVRSDFAFLTPSLDYDYAAGTVDLVLERNDISFASFAQTANQKAVAANADMLGNSHPLYQAIASLPLSQEGMSDAFTALSGEVHATIRSMLIDDGRQLRDAMTGRLDASDGGGHSPSLPVMAYGPDTTPAQTSSTDGLAIWGHVTGSWGAYEPVTSYSGMDTISRGAWFGYDASLFDDIRIGILGGYSRFSFNDAQRPAFGSSDAYHLGVYGNYQVGPLKMRAGAAHSWHDVQTVRSARFSGFSNMLSAEYDARMAQVFGEAGWRLDAGTAAIEPFAGVTHIHLATDAFTETGGAAALTVGAQDSQASFSTIGMRVSADISLAATEMALTGMAGWRHHFGDVLPVSSQSFSGGTPFSITGLPLDRDAAILAAGVDVSFGEESDFSLSYSGVLSENSAQHGVNAQLTVKF